MNGFDSLFVVRTLVIIAVVVLADVDLRFHFGSVLDDVPKLVTELGYPIRCLFEAIPVRSPTVEVDANVTSEHVFDHIVWYSNRLSIGGLFWPEDERSSIASFSLIRECVIVWNFLGWRNDAPIDLARPSGGISPVGEWSNKHIVGEVLLGTYLDLRGRKGNDGSLYSLHRFSREPVRFHHLVQLAAINESDDEEQSGRYFCPKQLFIILGCGISLAGLICLFKVLNQVYLNPRFNVNVAVCGFFFALGVFLSGGWIVFTMLRLM